MTWGEIRKQAELRERRAAQDAVLRERHAAFDLQAQDNHAKYERFRFSVVGEGSRDAHDNYRRGYEAIDWSGG